MSSSRDWLLTNAAIVVLLMTGAYLTPQPPSSVRPDTDLNPNARQRVGLVYTNSHLFDDPLQAMKSKSVGEFILPANLKGDLATLDCWLWYHQHEKIATTEIAPGNIFTVDLSTEIENEFTLEDYGFTPKAWDLIKGKPSGKKETSGRKEPMNLLERLNALVIERKTLIAELKTKLMKQEGNRAAENRATSTTATTPPSSFAVNTVQAEIDKARDELTHLEAAQSKLLGIQGLMNKTTFQKLFKRPSAYQILITLTDIEDILCQPPIRRGQIRKLRRQLEKAKKGMQSLSTEQQNLFVFLPNEQNNYSAVEKRRRIRQTVSLTMIDLGYTPNHPRKIQVYPFNAGELESKEEGRQYIVEAPAALFDHFELPEEENSPKESGQEGELPEQVRVVYLLERDNMEGQDSLSHYQSLILEIIGDATKNLDSTPETLKFIGPSSSDQLLAVLKLWHLNQDKINSNIVIYSPWSTVTPSILFNQSWLTEPTGGRSQILSAGFDDRTIFEFPLRCIYCEPPDGIPAGSADLPKQANDETTMQTAQNNGERWLRVVRTVGHDSTLIRGLVEELQRRGLNQDDGIVLICERDSAYGRNFSQEFNRQWDEAMGGTNSDEESKHAKEGLIQTVHFLSGIDSGLERKPDASSDTSTISGDPLESFYRKLSLRGGFLNAQGPSQFDYVERLAQDLEKNFKAAKRLKRKGENEKFSLSAIGIVSTDVYDKMALLQVLKPQFAGQIFFTTDLDADLYTGGQSKFSRNLVVSTSYGLAESEFPDHLRWDSENLPISYRENYQVAIQRAVRAALLNYGAGESLAEDEGGLVPQVATLFEIGSSRAVELATSLETGDANSNQLVSDPKKDWIVRNYRVAKPVLVIIGVLLGIVMMSLPMILKIKARWYGYFSLLAFLFVCTLFFLQMRLSLEPGSHWGNLNDLIEGVSLWPSIGILVFGFMLGLWFVSHGIYPMRPFILSRRGRLGVLCRLVKTGKPNAGNGRVTHQLKTLWFGFLAFFGSRPPRENKIRNILEWDQGSDRTPLQAGWFIPSSRRICATLVCLGILAFTLGFGTYLAVMVDSFGSGDFWSTPPGRDGVSLGIHALMVGIITGSFMMGACLTGFATSDLQRMLNAIQHQVQDRASRGESLPKLRLRSLEEISDGMAHLLMSPALILVCGILSRMTFLERWENRPDIILVFFILFFVLLSLALWHYLTIRHFKASLIHSLYQQTERNRDEVESERSLLNWGSFKFTSGSKRDSKGVTIGDTIKNLESLKGGAFATWGSNPLFQMFLVPVTVIVAIQLTEMMLPLLR
ncbi:MAG: hypothetical protein AAGK14_03935 [Verrucomicrobiota bacterium]